MAQQFKPSDDHSVTSASPSSSASVSINRESSELSPSILSSSPFEEQVIKIVENYLISKNLNASGIRKTVDDITKELTKKNDDDIKEIEKKISSAETEIQNSKQRVTETLGIFVALFTFVSVSFQIFDKVNDLAQIVSLELVLLGSLTIFILLLNLLMQPKKKRHEFGESFLNKPLKQQIKDVFKAIFWDKPIMLFLNNGTVTFLLILSILLLVSGTLGVFKVIEQNEYHQLKQNLELKYPIENNNSFNFTNLASPSSSVQ